MLSFEFLQKRGLTIQVAGDKLRVSPSEKVTPEVAAYIKTHRQEIMDELKSYPHEGLRQDMEATWQEVFRRVKTAYESKQKQFKATPHIFILEQRIGALQQAVLKGKASLRDFQLTTYEWERAAKSELN